MPIPVSQAGAKQYANYGTLPRLTTLTGTATNGPILEWEWRMLSVPKSSTANVGVNGDFTAGIYNLLGPALPPIQFTCDMPGSYVLQLRARNALGWSDPFLDKAIGQTIIVIRTQKLVLPIPSSYEYDYGQPDLNDALLLIEAAIGGPLLDLQQAYDNNPTMVPSILFSDKGFVVQDASPTIGAAEILLGAKGPGGTETWFQVLGSGITKLNAGVAPVPALVLDIADPGSGSRGSHAVQWNTHVYADWGAGVSHHTLNWTASAIVPSITPVNAFWGLQLFSDAAPADTVFVVGYRDFAPKGLIEGPNQDMLFRPGSRTGAGEVGRVLYVQAGKPGVGGSESALYLGYDDTSSVHLGAAGVLLYLDGQIAGDAVFASGANRSIFVATPGAAHAGYDLSVLAGAGNTGIGGNLTLQAGAGTVAGAMYLGNANTSELHLGAAGIYSYWSGTVSLTNTGTPSEVLMFSQTLPAVNDTWVDSDYLLMRGGSKDGANPAKYTDWLQFVDVTAKTGASFWTLRSRIGVVGYADRMTVSDAGGVTATGAISFKETGGAQLTTAAIPDTYLLKRSGTSIIGLSPTLSGIDHGGLDAISLTHDDHTQYALLAGRAGGQVLIGGTGATDKLTLRATGEAYSGGIASTLAWAETYSGGIASTLAWAETYSGGGAATVVFDVTRVGGDASFSPCGALTIDVNGELTVFGAAATTVLSPGGVLTLKPGYGPQTALLLDIEALGVPGILDSHAWQMTGRSYDASAHARDWRSHVAMVSQAGYGGIVFETSLDAGPWSQPFGVWPDAVAVKTHDAFAGSGSIAQTGAAQTTTASAATVWSLTLTDTYVYGMEATIKARNTDGTERAMWKFVWLCHREGGGAVLDHGGMAHLEFAASDNPAGWTCDVDVSGNDTRVRFTGENGKTINVVCDVTHQAVSGSA